MVGPKRDGLGEWKFSKAPRLCHPEKLAPKIWLNQPLPFNKYANYKKTVDPTDFIKISHIALIDRIQLSLRPQYGERMLSDLKSLFKSAGTILIEDKDRLIYKFESGDKRIEFVKWSIKQDKPVYYYSLISYQPDDEMQSILMGLMKSYHMTLHQVEVAFDFYSENPRDVYPIRSVLTDGLILRHSRAGCYFRYKGTEYMGKDGNKRKGSKGSTVYEKQDEERKFVRIELLFNRQFIKRTGISLPVNAHDFNLFDFVDYRQPLDEGRLWKLLCKMWARPVKKAAEVRMDRGLEEETIRSNVDWTLMYGPSTRDGKPVVADQISKFKIHFKPDNLAHRVGEFFPKSDKKVLISEDIKNGFVRREY